MIIFTDLEFSLILLLFKCIMAMSFVFGFMLALSVMLFIQKANERNAKRKPKEKRR